MHYFDFWFCMWAIKKVAVKMFPCIVEIYYDFTSILKLG